MAALSPGSIRAQGAPAGAAITPDSSIVAPATPDRFEVYLITADQGDAVWEQFGHNFLRIHDLFTGEDLAWNWGLFSFDAEDFLVRFLRGDMLYSMGPAEPDRLLASYVQTNRSVYQNRVNLSQQEAEALHQLVWENYQPENRDYLYHYFLDNCSTRVRDALDTVMGGLLGRTFQVRETPYSFRWHTRRLIQGTTWIDQGLSFLLGTRGDVPRTEWEVMFIPMELMRLLEGVERTDATGVTMPLLGPRETLFQASRPPTPAAPPGGSLVWPLLGLSLGVGLVALADRARRGNRWALAGFTLGATAWASFSAVLGGILVAIWFTNHDFIQWNLNVFYVSPAGVVLLPALWASLLPASRGGAVARGLAIGIASSIAVVAVAALILEATPFFGQGNGDVVSVALPLDLAVSGSLILLFRRPPG